MVADPAAELQGLLGCGLKAGWLTAAAEKGGRSTEALLATFLNTDLTQSSAGSLPANWQVRTCCRPCKAAPGWVL